MFLRFLCSSSEVWKSRPCQTLPSFNEDPEPGHGVALQDVFSPDVFCPSVSMARLSLRLLETDPGLGQGVWVWGQFEDLSTHSPFLPEESKQIVISSWRLISKGRMTWRGMGTCPWWRRGIKRGDLGCWWQALRTVAEGWLGTGVSLWQGL